MLGVRSVGRFFGWLLTGYTRGFDALGDALVRGFRAAGRRLQRVAPLLSRFLADVKRGWDYVSRWLSVSVLEPLGRWTERVLKPLYDPVDRFARRVGRGVLRATGPAWRAINQVWATLADLGRPVAAAIARASARVSAAVRGAMDRLSRHTDA